MLIRRSAKMLAENVDIAWPGFKKEFGSQKNSFPSTLAPHNDGAGHRVSERIDLPFTRRANFCRPTCSRVSRESEMRPVLVIQRDNATPIILNREKSVTFGILGTLALWLFTKPSPEMGELCFSVASMRSQELGSWRSHNGCLIRWPAAVCPWQPCPLSAAVRCWI